MHFQLKKTITYVGVLTALLPALSALAADEGQLDPDKALKRGQYPYDSNGVNVRSGFTQNCVLTGFWTPQEATPECNPDLFAKRSAPPVAAAQAAPQAAPAEPAAVEPAAVEPYQAAPYEEPLAAAVAAPAAAAAAAESSVPEFVTEAEPAGIVPVPSPDSFEPGAADDSISGPVVFFGDDGEGAAKDDGIIGRNEYYDEDTGMAQDDGIIAHEMYGEEGEGAVKDDNIIAESRYYDEEAGAVNDDNIIAESRYYDEEAGAVNDDDIIAQSRYYDEEGGAAKDDDIIGRNIYYDEDETASKDDGITALSQYHDEDEGAAKDDDIIAHNVYGNDDSGRNPEELVSEPKTFPEEKLAQAEEPKAAPVTMLPVTITVEADPLFDFDKYAVRPDSRKKLDELVQNLKSVSYGDVIVVGFADPIGTPMYNQKLSERRAAAVKRYLEGKGVPADKIKNEGRGETEEYASYQSCGGLRKTKLISCLQPDRRVEVTVTAQKQQ